MSAGRKGPNGFKPDLDNRNPFRGLPADFPISHSRFPIVPPTGYGSISFLPPSEENDDAEREQGSASGHNALRESMRNVFGADIFKEDKD